MARLTKTQFRTIGQCLLTGNLDFSNSLSDSPALGQKRERAGKTQSPSRVEVVPSSQYPKALLSIEISQSLTDQQLLFASLVAGGETHKSAATEAGFHPLDGFKLMQMPQVWQRVED